MTIARATIIFLAVQIFCSAPLPAEDVLVTATYDKRQASVSEEIHLRIKIEGAQGNIQAPRLPAFKGFDSYYTGRASHLSFINGRSSSSVEFNYVLVPQAEGSYTLDPIEVTVNGRNFRTDPTTIQVTGGGLNSQPTSQQQSPFSGGGGWQQPTQPFASPQAQQPVMQEPPPQIVPDDDNIYVTATLDKSTVYPNEQVVLTYSLYTRYDTRYEGFEEEPQISGFWIEEFPTPKEVERETVRVNGKRYVKAEIKKIALFPTTAAEYSIDPGSIKVSIRQEPQASSVFDEFFDDSFFSGGGFFARRENRLLKPPVIKLNVVPLPERGKPESFQGTVGNFRMQASVDKDTVKQNEPVTVKIVVEGEGNIETLNKPKIPEIENFKIYDADTSSQMFKTGNVIGGRKTFEVVFIPLVAGTVKIPQFELSYFSPQTASYQRLNTQEFSLRVAPGDKTFTLPTSLQNQEAFKKEVTAEAKDIRYIQERIEGQKLADSFRFLVTGLAVLNGILVILLLGTLWNHRQENLFRKDIGLKRRRFARSVAEKGLRHLQALTKSKNHEAMAGYFEEVEKILTQYVADKFNLSTLGMTRHDLERKLGEVLGPSDILNKEIAELFRICDEARFARASVPAELKHKAKKILNEAIRRVERTRVG